MPLISYAGCASVSISNGFHFSHAYMASNAITAGTDVFAQFWSRDSGFPPPQNVGLTNALKFSVLP